MSPASMRWSSSAISNLLDVRIISPIRIHAQNCVNRSHDPQQSGSNSGRSAHPVMVLYYGSVVVKVAIVADRTEPRRVLGALEAETMDVLWSSDAALSVREVLDSLNTDRTSQLAYTTAMTVLARLVDKGALQREQVGRRYVYTPAVADEAAIAVRSVVRDYGDAALAHFVEQAKADPQLYRRLRRLMGDGRS